MTICFLAFQSERRRIVAEKQNVIFSGWNWLDAILVGFGAIDFAFSVLQAVGSELRMESQFSISLSGNLLW